MGPERGILKIKPLKGCYLNSKLCYGVYICFWSCCSHRSISSFFDYNTTFNSAKAWKHVYLR